MSKRYISDEEWQRIEELSGIFTNMWRVAVVNADLESYRDLEGDAFIIAFSLFNFNLLSQIAKDVESQKYCLGYFVSITKELYQQFCNFSKKDTN